MTEPGRNVPAKNIPASVKNIPASVRQRLANLARTRGIEFQRILVLYAVERLLYRLSVSPFADRFVLKGASLFSLWLDEPHRRTRDVDLLGTYPPEPARFAALFQDLCALAVEQDGLRFAPETVKARPIREENEFGGVRVTLTAFLEDARITLQADIGFGDAAVPEPQEVDFPTLLPDFAAPRLRAYQKETAIAEKLHALVVLERANSRMKDFFDLYVLSQEFGFTREGLSGAVRDAFAQRATLIPTQAPDGLTPDFAGDAGKLAQWKAFLRQNVSPPRDTLQLPDVISALAAFLLPVLAAAADDRSEDFDDKSAEARSPKAEALAPKAATWPPGGPWQRDSRQKPAA